MTATVDGIKQKVQQGIEYLSTSWTGKGFASASGRNLTWITSLNASWKGRTLDTSLSADEKIILDKLEEDYREGKVDKDVYNSIKSGLLSSGIGFLQNAIVQKVSDVGASAIANAIYTWVRTNTTTFMDKGLVAALATGGDYLIQETPTWLTQAVRTGAKYTVPIVGTVIDYCLQRAQGEDAVDAGIKAVSHTAIGIGAAKVGATIGTAIGGPVGTAVGAATGFIIGVAGSMAFDWVYDNKEDIVDGIKEAGKKAKEAIDSVGDAVSGFFSGVSEIFT